MMTLLAVAYGLPRVPSSARGAVADDGPEGVGRHLPVDRGVNQRVADFTLDDVMTHRPVSLYSFAGKQAVVLVFLGTDCPIGNLYVPRLVELNHEYHPKGVVFLGINSNAREAPDQVARYVRETGIDFPVLRDTKNAVADTLLVERTCEVLVLDGRAHLRYRGAIDDQYAQGKRSDKPRQTYLCDALDAVLGHRQVQVPATPVSGCLLDRVDPMPTVSVGPQRIRAPHDEIRDLLDARDQEESVSPGPVTYSKEVSRIIADRCQACHRPHQIAPFSLLTYDEVRKHASMIHEVVEERRMPPWHADPRHGHFRNERRLSPLERATLLAWVEQGAPLGDSKDLPSPRAFPEGWTIGRPDVVFEMPETCYVPAQGVVPYVYYRVPTSFQEDRWVQAAEAVPGDRSVVHHIVIYVLDQSRPREPGQGPGEHFCAYAPGDAPTVLPEGTAKRIPAGAQLIFQLHYTPNGVIRPDRSKLGLIFAKSKPTRQAYTIGIANPDLIIPPEKDNVAVSSSIVLPQEVRLLGLLPHMHLRGKDFAYTATRPGAAPELLLSVPAYDFGWQSYYNLAQPMLLPEGTRIDCLAHFDNSAKNPMNPNPTRFVRWGEQTFEEMMIGYLDLEIPVGAPPLRGSDLRPRWLRAAEDAAKRLRRRTAGRDAESRGNPPK